MNPRHPASIQLPPETLQMVVGGLMALREMELEKVHRLIVTPHHCVPHGCISPKASGPGALDVKCDVFGQITGSSQPGVKILQVCSLNNICGSDLGGPHKSCEEWWESGHGELRKMARAGLPTMCGLMLGRFEYVSMAQHQAASSSF